MIVTLQPDGASGIDTQIRSGSSAGFNYGVSTTMGAGLGATLTDKGLLKFDLSSIPAGATIVSAVLTLTSILEDSTTDYNVAIHRSLVEWFEGTGAGAATPGVDGSTWNFRNANGSVAWAGGAGGAAGSDYQTTATDTTLITEANPDTPFDWDVTADVQHWANGNTNHGWWIVGEAITNHRKVFHQSGSSTPSSRPQLVIEYLDEIEGSAAGTVTVSATLRGKISVTGTATGIATVEGTLLSNQNLQGSTTGTSTVSGFLGATVYIQGNSFGDSMAVADIKASYHSVGSAAGTSAHVAHLKGIFELEGSTSGLGTLTATPSFQGQLRGSTDGTSDVTGTGYARARSVANVIGCNPVPLFYLTDGSIKPNGQLNILNFLSEKNGYLLRNYRPQIVQYKDGGRWSSSPQSQGRRLRSRTFDNAIDIIEVAANASDQDALIEYQQDLMAFQEAAADYWASEYPLLPYYLVARAARETNIRYAIIHMISCPELENPYSQPFFDHNGAAFEGLTIRIERGIWWSTPPGRFDCVEISSRKEWTVSGWQTGS